MVLLSLSNAEKRFEPELLFKGVSFSINTGDKIGLIGVNGAGKTTLFKMLLGEMPLDGGERYASKQTKLGYMQQHITADSEKTVYQEVLTVYEHVIETERMLKQIAEDIHQQKGDIEELIQQQHQLTEEFTAMGGYTYQSVAKASLLGLGFSEAELDQPFQHLSGGQKTRVVLCKILLSNANLLLLDEPTNHLDIASVEWLEGFLKEYNGAFMVISHDRYFLDKVTNKTFELEHKTLTVYDGNYSHYMEQKQLKSLTEERQYENTRREISRLEGIVKQQRQWNREKNIKTAESKLKVIDRLEKSLVKPQSEEASIHFTFQAKTSGGNEVLQCTDLSMGFAQKALFHQLNLFIKKGERVFLLGPNGCGKTTLFKVILDELAPLSGKVKIGANIEIGYYDQTQDNLDASKNVFEEVHDAFPKMTGTEVRNALAAFLFRGDDVFKPVSALSGGERARIVLLKMMLLGCNFLLLDEPTNHLDIRSREALEQALLDYNGTLFVVSHDRYFINKLASRICYMTTDGLQSYDGDYDYFQEKHKEAGKQEQAVQAPAGKLDYQQQKQLEAARRKRQNQLQKTEEQIAQTEQQIEALKEKLALPEYAMDYVKAMEVTKEIDTLSEALLLQYEQWEALSSEPDPN